MRMLQFDILYRVHVLCNACFYESGSTCSVRLLTILQAAALFFVLCFILSNFVVLNVIIAVVLEHFCSDRGQEKDQAARSSGQGADSQSGVNCYQHQR